MSDKSFGDCPNRNIVKNPLLSTAVTGLSIEDLTHNAVLVPVAASQGLITRSDPQIPIDTLATSEHEFTNFPSGDSNTNVFSLQNTPAHFPPDQTIPLNKTPELPSSTVSKASLKSEDDFDVNEYFARLQGSRYVSAPINSNPDQNANLGAEDNLEEINLNDDKTGGVQQSITADIAQNFSQLPTVLPHVASAVFSSFTNMLNYKSREQTPDDRAYQEVPFQSPGPGVSAAPGFIGQNVCKDTPLMAEDTVKEVAPPPKEPPVYGGSNFRITTKKKYAQIPGLSSGHNFETAQKIELNPLTKNITGYFIPTNDDKVSTEPVDTKPQELDHSQELTRQNKQETYNMFNPIESDVKASDLQPSTIAMPKENEPKPFEERLPPPPISFASQTNTGNNPIPPPPMFSTQQRDSSAGTGKSVLPPSVARRIGSNQPVMKPQAMQSINTDNIFVPTFDPTTIPTQPIGTFSDIHSQSSFGVPTLVSNQPASQELKEDIQVASMPPNLHSVPSHSAFIPQPPPGFATQPLAPPTGVIAPPSKVQPQKLASPPTKILASNIAAPPMLPPTLASNAPTMFVPSAVLVDDKSNTQTEPIPPLSSIFSPIAQVGAQAFLPPEQTQPTGIGSKPNAGLTPFFTPPSSNNAAPLLFNPGIGQEQLSQPIAPEPPKSLIEPPKSTGALNFRMNKRRPQYYSGPIEGVGSISNSIKPVIQPVNSGTFQGALFTPEVPQAEQNVQSSIPFDISKQTETVPLNPQFSLQNPSANPQLSSAFDMGQSAPVYSHFDITNPVQDNNQYSTSFDLSRPTTDSYVQEDPKESKGFGIIGSLKSKLSNIDINKIQNTVTTFFDPAYNETVKDEATAQGIVPYSNVPYQSQTAETNLEIFVPNVPQNTQAYNYDYQQQVYLNNEYYKYPNFQNQGQPSAGHCSNENNYPSLYTQNYQKSQGYPEIPTDMTSFQQPPSNAPLQEAVNPIPFNSPVKPEDFTPTTIIDNQETVIDRKVNENVAHFEPEVTQILQDKISIDDGSAKTFFGIAPSDLPMRIERQTEDLTATRKAVVSEVEEDRSLTSGSFEKVQETQDPKRNQMSMFDPITVDLFGKMAIKEDNNENANIFANKTFDEKEKINKPKYGTQNVDIANIATNKEKTEETLKLFPTMPVNTKEQITKLQNEVKTHNIFASTIFDKKEPKIPKDGLLVSLSKDDVPILGVSSVPLFGLSTIEADKSKEFTQGNDLITTVDRNSSMSFFDHPLKSDDPISKHVDTLNRNASFSFFENVGASVLKDERQDQDKKLDISGKTSASFFENVDTKSQNTKVDDTENQGVDLGKDDVKNVTGDIGTETADDPSESELSICETCREVNKPEDREDDQDVTMHLIENITSPIQLSNPVEAPLPESALRETNNPDQAELDAGQFDEISHITEETIETINVQSATELLEDVDEIKSMNYGWAESALKEDYNFNIDPTSIGFYGSNSLFFDKVPTSTDEMKHHEDMLTRQMSAPSAPPAEEDEEDSKSDEAGVLDVHSIEQDANKDFPLFEEFVIEPSDADDDLKEKDTDVDSFTNRVEKYKNMDPSESEPPQGLFFDVPPAPISMVSYFDTGNYAVESHYRNTRQAPEVISIPPGFEEEYKRRLALAKARVEKLKNEMITVPDTSTQTRMTTVASYATARMPAAYGSSEELDLVGFNVEENITSLVDEQSEQLSQESLSSPIPPFGNLIDPQSETLAKSFYGNVPEKSEEKQESKLFKFTPAFSAKSVEKPEFNLREFSTGFNLKPAEKQESDVLSSTTFDLKQTEVPKLHDFSGDFYLNPAQKQEAALSDFPATCNLKSAFKQESKSPDFPTTFSIKSAVKHESKSPDFPATFSLKPAELQELKSPDLPTTFGLKPEKEQNLPAFQTAITKPEYAPKWKQPELPAASNLQVDEPKIPETVAASSSKPEIKAEAKLPDPINFFANTTPENPPDTFNRLASYFSSPPKTDHAKSFFELSQSQNHYRHASAEQKNKIAELMNDLTSPPNVTVPKEQTIRHVNYFTVEYDAVLPEFSKGDTSKDKVEFDDDKVDLNSLVTNCRYCTKIFDTTFKVRAAMNDSSEAGTAPRMEPHKEAGRGSVTVNFDGVALLQEANEGVAGMTESRPSTEYTPVKHHWFYRVDVEDKSIWRGFSVVDSRALEAAYLSSDLDDQTVVATDGGRYDVNVVGRLRIPVYWSDKPTNVRRCSWFYKGTTDARYVPYTEPVAEKLEEEYRHGMTTGEWHRRLVIPNGEVVVMHGPNVMVHFLHSDAFSTPPLFSFGKRVYRNPPKIRVSRDQPQKIDHLILLVHGAGEYKCQKEKIQSSSRPRVVRRGHDESEIEDTEPSSIDHLLLLCHGVGSACDMRFRSVEEVVEDFRSTSLQLIQSHYRNSYDQGVVSRVEVLPISWHATLHSGETGVDRRLSQITLDSIPRLRSFTNDTVLDVLFYTSPVFCQTIVDTVCKELNRIYELFVERNPSFKGGVSLGGHSLGSVILYDLLCHQADEVSTEESKLPADKNYVRGSAGTGQPSVRYPRLLFSPAALYALGSPIAIFECIRGVESLGANFSLPTCKNFFNIFHPYDPIAYRIEPLIDPRLRDLKPFLIPHHKGRKRMHLELKDTMARVGADLKQKLLESLKSTWNKWKAQPPTDGQLEKVVEEEIEKDQLCDSSKEELARESELSTPDMLGCLNGGRRVDYVLQEAPLEMINEYLFAMSSHVGYWESEDTMLLMLREIYSALGVQPDSTVPQQNMTVQRTRNAKQDETIILNASEFPSTSHGAI